MYIAFLIATGELRLKNIDKPVRSPHVVLREEFDDWAILYDPDTGHGFGLNPTSVYLWKLMDGEHSISEMLEALRPDAYAVPMDAYNEVCLFIDELVRSGLAAWERSDFQDDREKTESRLVRSRWDASPRGSRFTYEPPRLVSLGGERAAGCYHCTAGSTDTHCYSGACAEGGLCSDGTSAGGTCGYGSQTGFAPCGNGNNTGFYCGEGNWATGSNCICGTHAASSKTCAAGPFNTC